MKENNFVFYLFVFLALLLIGAMLFFFGFKVGLENCKCLEVIVKDIPQKLLPEIILP